MGKAALLTTTRAMGIARVMAPQQKLFKETDGSLLMEVPFTDATELAMDILRHGQHVEVLEPADLKSAICAQLRAALSEYEIY